MLTRQRLGTTGRAWPGLTSGQREPPYPCTVRQDPVRWFAIYAANHQSGFDILALSWEITHSIRWLWQKAELFRIPILGQAMKASGYIPIDRDNRIKPSRASISRQDASGRKLHFHFPGRHAVRMDSPRLQEGWIHSAIQSQHPIVPISITGSHRSCQSAANGGLAWQHSITVGQPIPTAGSPQETGCADSASA
jgi:1-acyl-sn-glycerol-3-phosphate acyltransferase